MKDGLLPAMLLSLCAGMASGAGKARIARLLLAAIGGVGMSVLVRQTVEIPAEAVLGAGWTAMLACAAMVLAGKAASPALATPIAAGAGLLSGLLAADWHALPALPMLLAGACAARIAAAHRLGLATKVVAGWLLAIAALNFSLALLPVTPGYLPDHLE